MRAAELSVGKVYFMIMYDDEAMTKMVIQSYEYLGPAPESRPDCYWFTPLSPFPVTDADISAKSVHSGPFELTAQQLESLVDLPDLIDRLQRIQRNGPGRMWGPMLPNSALVSDACVSARRASFSAPQRER